jgi:hypothetical protein
MDNAAEQDYPRTIGELRRRLSELGNPWEVDPQLSDEDPMWDPPRGGQREEDIPEEARLPSLDPDTDIDDIIAAEPPANPLLRARWVEAGLLDQDEVEGLPLESDEGEGGAG